MDNSDLIKIYLAEIDSIDDAAQRTMHSLKQGQELLVRFEELKKVFLEKLQTFDAELVSKLSREYHGLTEEIVEGKEGETSEPSSGS